MCGEDILHLLPIRIRCMVEKLRLDYGRLWEIRLRVNSPFILRYEDSEIYVDSCGSRTCNMKDAYIVTARDVNDTLECICIPCMPMRMRYVRALSPCAVDTG